MCSGEQKLELPARIMSTIQKNQKCDVNCKYENVITISRGIKEGIEMLSLKSKTIVSLAVVTVFTAMAVGIPLVTGDTPPDYHFDMNDDINWKDAHSSVGDMDIENQVVLWNNYDHVEVDWPRIGWGVFNAYLYCYGGHTTYDNKVEARVYDGTWHDLGTETCESGDYGVVSWQTHSISPTTGIIFEFWNDGGYVAYGENSDWSDAVIKIQAGSEMFPRYWYLDTIDEMSYIDSCYEYHPTCSDLHSEVSNYVKFESGSYLRTRDFTVSETRSAKAGIYARCTGSCSMDLYVDDYWIETKYWSGSSWSLVWFTSSFILTADTHDVRIDQGYYGVMDWQYVAVDLL